MPSILLTDFWVEFSCWNVEGAADPLTSPGRPLPPLSANQTWSSSSSSSWLSTCLHPDHHLQHENMKGHRVYQDCTTSCSFTWTYRLWRVSFWSETAAHLKQDVVNVKALLSNIFICCDKRSSSLSVNILPNLCFQCWKFPPPLCSFGPKQCFSVRLNLSTFLFNASPWMSVTIYTVRWRTIYSLYHKPTMLCLSDLHKKSVALGVVIM